MSGSRGGVTRAGAGLRFEMEVEGFEAISVGLSRFGDRVGDLTPFWRDEFATWMFRRIASNFETEGAYVGGWEQLAADYRKWKTRHYPGKTILRRTDAMFKSLTKFDDSNSIFRADATSIEFGTRVPYFRFHQLGTSRMPRRSMLFVNRETHGAVGRLLHRYLVGQASQTGLGGPGRRSFSESGLL